MKTNIFLAAFFCFAVLGTRPCFATENVPEEYVLWLSDLRKDMKKRGVSDELLQKIYANPADFYEKKPEVVAKDRSQTEFVLSSSEYLTKVVNKQRVEAARKKYKELAADKNYRRIEKKYGVPLNYLVAFWGVETNFGEHIGNYNWIKSLTQLAYDKRRAKFFRDELYYALKILQKNKLEYQNVKSSWAGAVGHFQFMPSTYWHYAVDYDGDDAINLQNSRLDAFASAGNYLKKSGWKKDTPWGVQVDLPWNFDYNLVGREHIRKIKYWKQSGIKTNLPADMSGEKAYIVLPEGRRGNAYMVMQNFDVIMKWNRSVNYALAVGLLADYVASDKPWEAVENEVYQITRADIKKIQKFYNKHWKQNLSVDGKIGAKTAAAIKKMQNEYKLPADGYPDYRFMKRVNAGVTTQKHLPAMPPKQKGWN